jgi:hypothetical protein
VRPVAPRDLDGLPIRSRVIDTIIHDRHLARSATARSEVFVDQHGHNIWVETDIQGLDLAPYASVLAGTLHYDEIQDLVVEVVVAGKEQYSPTAAAAEAIDH